jgi:hypothetical protein
MSDRLLNLATVVVLVGTVAMAWHRFFPQAPTVTVAKG